MARTSRSEQGGTAARLRAQARGTTRVRRGDSVLARDDDEKRVRTSLQTLRAVGLTALREALLIGLAGFSVLLLLALLSFHPRDVADARWGEVAPVRNWVGPLGANVAEVAVTGFGLTAFVSPFLFGLFAAATWMRRDRKRALPAVGLAFVVLSLSLLFGMVFADVPFRGGKFEGGGAVGGGLADLLLPQLSRVGTAVVGVTTLLIASRFAFSLRVIALAAAFFRVSRSAAKPVLGVAQRGARGAGWGLKGAARGLGDVFRQAWDEYQDDRAAAAEERRFRREEARAQAEEDELLDDVAERLPAEPVSAERMPTDEGSAVARASTPTGPRPSRVRIPTAMRGLGMRIAEDAGTDSMDAGDDEGPGIDPGAEFDARPGTDAGAGIDAAPGLDAGADSLDGRGEALAAGARPAISLSSRPPGGPKRIPSAPSPAPVTVDSLRGASIRGVVHAELRPKRGGPSLLADIRPLDREETDDAEITDRFDADDDGSFDDALAALDATPRPAITRPPSERTATAARRILRSEPQRPFERPGLVLLEKPPPGSRVVDETDLEQQAARLEETLGHYNVQGRVTNILPGPVVTMFEFEPAPGIKVSRIANLENDLAMALRATRVRIVAPIPGKGAVGIEVPSRERETIYLYDILGSQAFQAPKFRLPLAIGKGIDGSPVVSDWSKMPHVLVAGTTGSGKSVCVNSFILSLLYTHTPDDVRMILVDPKMLEFSIYDGIPHLLVPVVTSPKKASMALKWAVEEMTRRYRVLAAMNVRNIVGYNEKAAKLREDWAAYDKAREERRPAVPPDCGRAAGEDTVVFRSQGGEPVGPPDRMPYIVIVIDELADLMMVARKDVEESIVRLAQMARAAGIHMLLATQRPSVDVITGLIKANFPTRLSFKVSSKVDSRTVLDANGAENLLGMGDGLFLAPGSSDMRRIHGAFVTDGEVERVVAHLKTQGEPEYIEHVLEGGDDEEGDEPIDAGELDSMYDQAVAVVAAEGKASTSLLQRKLGLGYNRAARIMDVMEQQGVIGPQDGARPRRVFVAPV